MKITFSDEGKESSSRHQARIEQIFSTGEGHGDFCLTAYGETREEAHANLQQLAHLMARALDVAKRP